MLSALLSLPLLLLASAVVVAQRHDDGDGGPTCKQHSKSFFLSFLIFVCVRGR